MTGRPWGAIAVIVTCCLQAAPAWAQRANDAVPQGLELSAGAVWIGKAAVGTRDATLTGSGGNRFRLFSTSSELGDATGFNVRIGRHVTSVIEAEVSASYASPLLTTSLSGDAEAAPATAASESITQFTIEGGALRCFDVDISP